MTSIVDFSEFNPTDMATGGDVAPGKAVLQIIKLIEKDGEYGPYQLVVFKVLAHEKPTNVAREYTQICPLSGKAAQGTMKLALAAGIVTMEEIANAAAQGTQMVLPLEKLMNLVVAGTIKEGKNKKQKIWEFYGILHPEFKEYPKVATVSAGEEGEKPIF